MGFLKGPLLCATHWPHVDLSQSLYCTIVYRGVGVQVLKVITSKSIDEREFFHYNVENITEEDKIRY